MKQIPVIAILLLLYVSGCKESGTHDGVVPAPVAPDFETEKKAILETLTNETMAAFARDYETWQSKWVHDSSIVKTYMNFADSSFSESIGWQKTDDFVKQFFKDHPQAEPAPEMLSDINVRLYGTGAWVTFEQQDSIRGRKREARLMEKVNGEWKIAGMQTTIYGFEY